MGEIVVHTVGFVGMVNGAKIMLSTYAFKFPLFLGFNTQLFAWAAVYLMTHHACKGVQGFGDPLALGDASEDGYAFGDPLALGEGDAETLRGISVNVNGRAMVDKDKDKKKDKDKDTVRGRVEIRESLFSYENLVMLAPVALFNCLTSVFNLYSYIYIYPSFAEMIGMTAPAVNMLVSATYQRV